MGRLLPDAVAPAAVLEKRALEETQRALEQRVSSAAIALAAAALVFVCLPDVAAGLAGFAKKYGAWTAAGLCVVAVGFWWRFLRACRRLRAAGLKRSRNLTRTRWAWAASGYVTGAALVGTVVALLRMPLHLVYFNFALIPIYIALWLGEKLGEVAEFDAMQRAEWSSISLRQGPDEEE